MIKELVNKIVVWFTFRNSKKVFDAVDKMLASNTEPRLTDEEMDAMMKEMIEDC